MGKRFAGVKNDDLADLAEDSPLLLKEILGGSLAAKNPGSDFLASLKYALDTDPEVIVKQREVKAKLASVEAAKAQKDFRVGTTLYGGVEDVTDNTKGVALALDASRLVFDGGKTDSQIASTIFEVESREWTWRQL